MTNWIEGTWYASATEKFQIKIKAAEVSHLREGRHVAPVTHDGGCTVFMRGEVALSMEESYAVMAARLDAALGP